MLSDTRDYQKLGSVADLSRHAFRVKVGGWSRDYWLSKGAIRSIASDGAVMLLIDKSQLGQNKLKTGIVVD